MIKRYHDLYTKYLSIVHARRDNKNIDPMHNIDEIIILLCMT